MSRLCIIPLRALEDKSLTDSDLRTLLAVGSYTNSDGAMWASQAKLAARSGLSRETVNRSLKRLHERGYVRKVRRFREDGSQTSSMVDVIFDGPDVKGYVTGASHPRDGAVTPPVTQLRHTMKVPSEGNNDDYGRTVEKLDTRLSGMEPKHVSALTAAMMRHPSPLDLLSYWDRLNSGAEGEPHSWPTIAQAVHEMHVAGAPMTPRALRAFIAGLKAEPGRGRGRVPSVDFEAAEANLAQAEPKFGAHSPQPNHQPKEAGSGEEK